MSGELAFRGNKKTQANPENAAKMRSSSRFACSAEKNRQKTARCGA